MKIAALDGAVVEGNYDTVVRMGTAADGLSGLGECYTGVLHRSPKPRCR